MLRTGQRAPSFSLPDQEGRVVSLADFAGRTVVLYFYPEDDTPGCTVQACEFRDAWGDLEAAGAVVLGVSPDDPESHARFRRKRRLPFPLLADPDLAVSRRYGAWGEKQMFGRKYQGMRRNTYVIDGKGIIRHVFERVRPRGHAARVLAALRG